MLTDLTGPSVQNSTEQAGVDLQGMMQAQVRNPCVRHRSVHRAFRMVMLLMGADDGSAMSIAAVGIGRCFLQPRQQKHHQRLQ